MANKHDLLVKKAEKVVDELYSDTSVSKEQTKSDLENLIDEINFKIKAMGF
jgi:hypothetical protein